MIADIQSNQGRSEENLNLKQTEFYIYLTEVHVF